MLAHVPVPKGVQGFGWFLVILAFLVDLALLRSGGRGRQLRAGLTGRD